MERSEEELIGKKIMSKEGYVIGLIKGLLLDKNTGESTSILVKPSKEIDPLTYKHNEQGDIIFPLDSIATVKNISILENSQSE